ncbi:MAG: hypothetical protein AMXMBFR84_33360 [Candidatus Hydrogenedentota bacterium]
MIRPEKLRATVYSAIVTGFLTLLIVVGSRNLEHFDAPLVAYTFATLFATFGITYRYAIWLQRPPTAVFWRRGWQAFLQRNHRSSNLKLWLQRVGGQFALNDFMFKRGVLRWLAHMLIMWGCLLAVAITFPLVFGWIYFESLPDRIDWYRVVVFGFPTVAIPHDSWFAFLIFHGLVWASLMVIPGVMLAMRRRMRDEGAAALETFSEDFLPLILLFAVSLSGLLLTVSYTWLEGYGYDFLALAHAVTVIFTLLWLPFGKFFHVFQRPAQLGVEFYKDVATREPRARCARCNHPFASEMHVHDLIETESALGYRYDVEDCAALTHYQFVCPPCRRVMFALAQSRIAASESHISGSLPLPRPAYANPGLSEGPLGREDAENFHP